MEEGGLPGIEHRRETLALHQKENASALARWILKKLLFANKRSLSRAKAWVPATMSWA
jgi:hypothetical protein